MKKQTIDIFFGSRASVTIPVALLDTLDELTLHTIERRNRASGSRNGSSRVSYIVKFDEDGILSMRSVDIGDRYVPYLSPRDTWYRRAPDGSVVEVEAGEEVPLKEAVAAGPGFDTQLNKKNPSRLPGAVGVGSGVMPQVKQ